MKRKSKCFCHRGIKSHFVTLALILIPLATLAEGVEISADPNDAIQAYAVGRLERAFGHNLKFPQAQISLEINKELPTESYQSKVLNKGDD